MHTRAHFSKPGSLGQGLECYLFEKCLIVAKEVKWLEKSLLPSQLKLKGCIPLDHICDISPIAAGSLFLPEAENVLSFSLNLEELPSLFISFRYPTESALWRDTILDLVASLGKSSFDTPLAEEYQSEGETKTTIAVCRHPFEDDLKASRVYNRTQFYADDVSFRSTTIRTHAWSVFSGTSIADVSCISVIALPLYAHDIYNSQHYQFGEIGRAL
jgi:hypothetical protein